MCTHIGTLKSATSPLNFWSQQVLALWLEVYRLWNWEILCPDDHRVSSLALPKCSVMDAPGVLPRTGALAVLSDPFPGSRVMPLSTVQRKEAASEHSASNEAEADLQTKFKAQRMCLWDTCCVQGPAGDKVVNTILASAQLKVL